MHQNLRSGSSDSSGISGRRDSSNSSDSSDRSGSSDSSNISDSSVSSDSCDSSYISDSCDASRTSPSSAPAMHWKPQPWPGVSNLGGLCYKLENGGDDSESLLIFLEL